jgi:membrane protein required for colicin V production
VTVFDYGAGLLLLASGLIGLARGATREITTVLALVLAAIIAMFTLRFSGPIARHSIHAAWLANIAAILFVFILAYVVLRLIGGMLTRSVQQTSLSGVDRGLGFGIGLVRALVVLGGFALIVNAATPPERMPHWIADAKLYPLASAAGSALRRFAPRGMQMARRVAPVLEDTTAGTEPPTTPQQTNRDSDLGHGAARERHWASDSLKEESR